MSDVKWSEWIEWRGGKCPLIGGRTYHQVRFRNDQISQDQHPEEWRWQHIGAGSDIVSYRYNLKSESGISEDDEEECIQLAYERMSKQQADMVNHPPHYQSDNGIECIDAIRDALGKDGFVAYCRGNVIKYSWRMKTNPAEDQGKAAWYATKAREALEE